MNKNLKGQISKLPNSPGIYKFFDKENRLLYVGKSIQLKKRVTSYFTSSMLGPKTDLLVSKIRNIQYVKVFSEFEALLLESELIRTSKPFFNVIAKDDKSPIYIQISGQKIPLITTTRKTKKTKGIFVKGPFPSAKSTREILRIIRKIFPYCHHQNPKKPCLYVHLGLCPYPWLNSSQQTNYLKVVAKIKKLLSGKTKELVRDLKEEMKSLSKKERFEQANIIKNQITMLESLTTTYHAPEEFLKSPTLVDDLAFQKISSLANALGLPKPPNRIECYDISNISGKYATGSMVVFVNGQTAKDQYRRFRIKFLATPNDFEMLREVLTRRFKNTWSLPDLVIIDGGKGQLNVALSVINGLKLKIPAISLAKKFEEIYTWDKVLPISLPKESFGRQLAQQVRDEAHRFAISYHRHLRSKAFLSS